jgi:uncharacterized protein YndB with AHSA1/START domain
MVMPMTDDIVVQRSIAAPADHVWAMISDVTRMGEWSPENTGGVWRKGATGPQVGASFKGTNKNGKKNWSTVCTVTAADPGRRFAFDVHAVVFPIARWSYELEPNEAGCTVTEATTDRRSSLMKWLGNKISGVADRAASNRAGMETTLERIAAAAEAP